MCVCGGGARDVFSASPSVPPRIFLHPRCMRGGLGAAFLLHTPQQCFNLAPTNLGFNGLEAQFDGVVRVNMPLCPPLCLCFLRLIYARAVVHPDPDFSIPHP